ncbi:Orn/Lys/Arg family decarboxylase, partial [Anaerotignum sp.]
VLTGGAYLHLSQEWAEKVGHQAKKAMEIFGSTSPSYLIMQSLDKCNEYLADGYPEKLALTIDKVAAVKTFLQKQGWEVMDGDPLKLTIFTGKMGYTGEEVAEALRKNGVECEFADLDAVVLMATPENKDRDFEKVLSVLSSLPQKEELTAVQMPVVLPERKMSIREAMFSQWEEVECKDAVGRICASPCVSCPPAIPIAASGEEITAEIVELFEAYGIEKIEVVK